MYPIQRAHGTAENVGEVGDLALDVAVGNGEMIHTGGADRRVHSAGTPFIVCRLTLASFPEIAQFASHYGATLGSLPVCPEDISTNSSSRWRQHQLRYVVSRYSGGVDIVTDCHNCIAVQPVSLHFCNIRHNSETSPVSTSNCLLADISTGASCNAIWLPTMRLRRLQWRPRTPDPHGPAEPDRDGAPDRARSRLEDHAAGGNP